MPYSMPDHVNQDLKRLRETGGTRVSRIRAIVKQAFAETLTEVQGGSTEVHQIIKEAVSTTLESSQPLPNSSTTVSSVVVEPGTDVAPAEAIVTIEVDNQQTPSHPTRSLLAQFIAWLKAQPSLQEQYQSMKVRLENVDRQLSERYGDRYQTVKNQTKDQANNAKVWYQETKAKVDAGEESPGDRFQRRLDTNAQVVGVSAAQTEKALKQRLQDWWKSRQSS